MSNFGWAGDILRQRYPDWKGIDELVADALGRHATAGAVVLDVGCGRSSPLSAHRHWTRLAVGTDIEIDEIRMNRDLQAWVVSDGARLPFAAGTFDLLLSKTAIEHMQAPTEFFAGVNRVLKPGGVFIWATPNLCSLPILVSYLTPMRLHRWVYRRLFGQGGNVKQFPTFYRANTESVAERQLTATGFERISLRRASWPFYFAFSRLLFRAMLPVHRWADGAGITLLQVHLIGAYRKGSAAGTHPPSQLCPS